MRRSSPTNFLREIRSLCRASSTYFSILAPNDGDATQSEKCLPCKSTSATYKIKLNYTQNSEFRNLRVMWRRTIFVTRRLHWKWRLRYNLQEIFSASPSRLNTQTNTHTDTRPTKSWGRRNPAAHLFFFCHRANRRDGELKLNAIQI